MRNKVLLFPLALALLLAVIFRPPPGQAGPPHPSPAVQEAPPLTEPPETAEPETTPSGPGPPLEAHMIESCTVTWYTEDTCGKAPDHPAYGITASGLPVEEGVTCAVDPEVIPLFSTVHVEYADGSAGTFRATDTGVKGNWVDIYTPDYDYAVRCGLQSLTVCWTAPEEGTP